MLRAFRNLAELDPLKRRDFITLVGGTAWSLVARAQGSMPLVAVINAGAPETNTRRLAAFRKGLGETGYVEGQNVTVEYSWLGGHYERLSALVADMVRRQVAVIATPANQQASLVAKAATSSIPIVFGVSEDPVTLGLVASLARPGGNATGINFYTTEVVAKRLGLLHELLPKATRIAVLINSANASSAEATLKEATEAARALGMQVQVLNASTDGDIDAVFAAMERTRVDALFVAGDAFFTSRSAQFAALAARYRMPTSYAAREMVEAGVLMSYGTDVTNSFRQVGNYVGRILKGEKPADLPVQQSTKFEFVINMRAARALGLDVPNSMQLLADEVIE
jgi:putative ABC transport system substrate-binding protein